MNAGSVLNYQAYAAGGSEEWLLRIGNRTGTPILFVPPLFEELNRTRTLLVGMMRLLALQGHGCWLIDLPGCGESVRALEDCRWADWRQAVADAAAMVAEAAGRSPHVATVRGGALLDDAAAAPSRWRFAPVAGASLVRDLERASLVAAAERTKGLLELAGYPLGPELVEPLRGASPAEVAPLRTVRLASDRHDAALKLNGPALWRRSEPGSSPELAAALATDLTSWIGRCDGC